MSNWVNFTNSVTSMMFDPDIQPKVGDIFEIKGIGFHKKGERYNGEKSLYNKFDEKGDGRRWYNMKLLNRKIKVPKFDDNSIGPDISWIDDLVKQGKIKKLSDMKESLLNEIKRLPLKEYIKNTIKEFQGLGGTDEEKDRTVFEGQQRISIYRIIKRMKDAGYDDVDITQLFNSSLKNYLD